MDKQIVLTDEDLQAFLSEPPRPSGFAFYDSSGTIRGVSHGLDHELAERFDYIEITTEQAQSFMSGETDLSKWLVVYQGDGPKLICSVVDTIMVMPSKDTYRVVNDTASAPVQISILVPRDRAEGVISLHTTNGATAAPGFDHSFELIVTARGIHDQVIALIAVDPKTLFEQQEIEFSLGRIVREDIDVLTKPLWPVQYRLERFDETSRPLPLPRGRYEEFVPFCKIETKDVKPGLLVEVHESHVHLGLIGDGGRIYDRPLESLLVAATRTNDREAMLWRARVSLADLASGIDIQAELEGEIDIVSARYFLNTYWRDLRRT